MTREDAINYLYSSGFSEEQVKTIAKAFEPTTKNDLGVDTDKLIADCEKMSFDIEIFNKPLKVVALDAVKNIAKDLINSENPNKSEILTGSTTKNDLGVDREDAVERLNALKQFIGYDKDSEIVKATQKSLDMAICALEHPERNVVSVVPCGDAISRSDVLKLMQDNWHTHNGDWAMQESIDDIRVLPSVTPQAPRWIPVKFRPLTDEEQDEYPDYCYMADCPMPDDGEEILVCTAHGGVEKDECGFEDGFYLDSGYDWQTDVVAWMPLPKPYEPQEREDNNDIH